MIENRVKNLFFNKYFLFALGLLSVIFCAFILLFQNTKRNNQNLKYTIAEVVGDSHHQINNDFGTHYEYYVNNKRYKNPININAKKENKYLIVFDSINPQKNSLLEFYEINNTISLKPQSIGWKYKEIPFFVDSLKVNKYVAKWD